MQPLVLTLEDRAASKDISAEDRAAVHIVARDLDLHLNTHTGQIEARAEVTVQNGSTKPLEQVLLRISGALQWDSARVAGQPAALPVQQHHLADDLDHTGLATEVAVSLPVPIAAGETARLDLYYSGTLAQTAQRLTALGAPAGRAALTDWDTVSDTFTGLRGEGNVLWYPIAGVPASLQDSSAVPAAVAASRAAEQGSVFHLRLTAEYTGPRPASALFCGEERTVAATGPADSAEGGGFVTAEWTRTPLGLHTPSLFLTAAAPQPVAAGAIHAVTAEADVTAALGQAAGRLRPMLQEWLGAAPQRSLQVLDLPVPGAAAFADGALLVAPLTTVASTALPSMLVQPLAAAWLPDGIASPWLREGIPAFLETVWMERTAGREAALTALQGSMKTLAAAADPQPAFSSSAAEAPVWKAGPPLAQCTDPACARVRAAYVFGMLRSMLGDAALQQALSGWAVQQAAHPGRPAVQETRAMEDLLQQVAGKRDLGWFFANWIDADRGLPELQIVTVAPRRVDRSRSTDIITAPKKPVAGPIGAEPVAPSDPRDMGERDAAAYAAVHGNDAIIGSWLVAVEVQNNGDADAEVPVTVRAAGLSNTLPLRVPAHGRATIRIPFEAEPEEVQVNDGSVPESIPVQHRRALRKLATQ